MNMTNTFKEILSMPPSHLYTNKSLFSFFEFMQKRVLKHSKIFSMPAIIEAFFVTALYKFEDNEEAASIIIECLSVFWASTDKNGTTLVEIAKNCALIIDMCLKDHSSQQKANTDLPDDSLNKNPNDNSKSDLSGREKLEELVMDRNNKINLPNNLKFAYTSNKAPQLMIKLLSSMIHQLDADLLTVDVEPLINLVRKCMDLSLEKVAYSDQLTLMRTKLRLGALDLAKSCLEVFAGSYHDFYPIIFDDIKWKSEDLSLQCSFIDLFVENFSKFPNNFHQTIIFEEPNLINVIPKLLVWTPKHQEDNSNSHLPKSKKISQNSLRLSEGSLMFDWIDLATKKATPETVFAFRKLCMICE